MKIETTGRRSSKVNKVNIVLINSLIKVPVILAEILAVLSMAMLAIEVLTAPLHALPETNPRKVTGMTGGNLVIIGGALQPDNEHVYQTFIRLGGGVKNIRIAIIPAAGGSPVKSGKAYVRDFVRYGVPETQIKVFPLAVKDDPSTATVDESLWAGNGSDKKLAEEMARYNAVFFVGGDQERYIKTLLDKEGNDTPLLSAIREIYRKGGVLGGTSAGAAIMSDPMICGGSPIDAALKGAIYKKENCPAGNGVRLTRGLGFFKGFLVDQHFIKRGRLGRLIPALLYLKEKNMGRGLGIGVDEDTALVFRSQSNTVEVAGRSGILLVDTRNIVSRQSPLGTTLEHIHLSYLEKGDRFNIKTGEYTVSARRNKIKKGKEYYETSPLNTHVFGKDAVKEILTRGLADNREQETAGLAFTLDSRGIGRGIKLIFRKTADTSGYWGKIDGKETYSVLNVQLELTPISVKISEETID
jgi:cyanophycinase